MATAIPEILAKLPERAPEIIREVNPVTWFERVIHEYHEYTLAEKKISAEVEREKGLLQLELEKLKAQKEVYLASIDSQRRLIEEGHRPTMKALEMYAKELDNFHEESRRVLDMILESTNRMDVNMVKTLIACHQSFFDRRTAVYENIQKTLDKSSTNIQSQFAAITSKVNSQKYIG